MHAILSFADLAHSKLNRLLSEIKSDEDNINQQFITIDKLSKYREDHIDASVSVLIRKLFKTYAGIKGTEIYNAFENGSMIYVCAILKK